MSIEFTKEDRQFLKSVGAAEPKAKARPKAAPKTQFDGTVPFDAAEMERRWLRLKAEGRLPSLTDVLRVVRKVADESKQ